MRNVFKAMLLNIYTNTWLVQV